MTTSNGDNYWELLLKDGTRMPIPPAYVEVVKKRWDAREPIHTKSRSIPASDIADFYKTGRKVVTVPLLDSAAQAFKDPMYNDDGDIVCRWVKKEVTTTEYQKRYSQLSGYHNLGSSENGLVTIAYSAPVHLIDTSKVSYCSEEEISRLT